MDKHLLHFSENILSQKKRSLRALALLFTICILVLGSKGQNFRYLNASSGNENDFPVDKDTNIYMFHGNRLVKTDKNFNTVWAKTYSGIDFSSLLLSKTGSMFFTAKSMGSKVYIGKLNYDGTLNWMYDLSTAGVSTGSITGTDSLIVSDLCLDRNNDLIISGQLTTGGSSYFIKMDTLGNPIKMKLFPWSLSPTYFKNFTIVGDYNGTYIFSGFGGSAGSPAIGLTYYRDSTDAIKSVRELSLNGLTGNITWRTYRSHYASNFYLMLTSAGQSAYVFKFNSTGAVKWVRAVVNAPGFTPFASHVEDGPKGEVLFSFNTATSSPNCKSVGYRIDSTGARVYSLSMLNNFPVYNVNNSTNEIPSHALRSIGFNKYYFDMSGYYFPVNPLTVQRFDSTLAFACSTTSLQTFSVFPGGTGISFTPTVSALSTITLTPYTVTVTPIVFTVNQNFCIIMATEKKELQENEFLIAPNPVCEKLIIQTPSGETPHQIEVIDGFGKLVKFISGENEIIVNDLPDGIYVVRIKTSASTLTKRIIKVK